MAQSTHDFAAFGALDDEDYETKAWRRELADDAASLRKQVAGEHVFMQSTAFTFLAAEFHVPATAGGALFLFWRAHLQQCLPGFSDGEPMSVSAPLVPSDTHKRPMKAHAVLLTDSLLKHWEQAYDDPNAPVYLHPSGHLTRVMTLNLNRHSQRWADGDLGPDADLDASKPFAALAGDEIAPQMRTEYAALHVASLTKSAGQDVYGAVYLSLVSILIPFRTADHDVAGFVQSMRASGRIESWQGRLASLGIDRDSSLLQFFTHALQQGPPPGADELFSQLMVLACYLVYVAPSSEYSQIGLILHNAHRTLTDERFVFVQLYPFIVRAHNRLLLDEAKFTAARAGTADAKVALSTSPPRS